MYFTHSFERDQPRDRTEQWPPERIERELFELRFARATCVPAEER